MFTKPSEQVNSHLFEIRGRKIAFDPCSYNIRLLSDEEYCELKDVQESEICFYDDNEESEATENFPLQSLCLLLTSKCNLSCRYCFNNGGLYDETQHSTMNIETGKNAIEFLLRNCCNSGELSFFGGEPLVEFSIIKNLVEYAEKRAQDENKNIRFHITTNGTLINEDIANFLNLHNFSVIVSIDGAESVHDCNRKLLGGKGSYKLAIRGAKTLSSVYKDQSKLTIRGTFTNGQLTSISESFQHLSKLGFENISIEPAMGDTDDIYALRENDIVPLALEYDNLVNQYKSITTEYPHTKFFHLDKFIQDILNGNQESRPCGAANGTMTVSANGDLFPCHRIVKPEYRLGNVNDIILSGALLDNKIQNSFANATVNNREQCKHCWAKKICGGTCYAYSIEHSMSLADPESFACAFMKLCIENSIDLIVDNNLDITALSSKKINLATAYTFSDSGSSSECRSGGQTCWTCEKSCTSGCTSSCTSSCTKGCTSGCTKSCTSGCTTSCTSNCTSGCTSGCTSACTWQDR